MNESNLVTNEEQETRNLWGYLNHSKISLKVFVKDILSLFEDNAEVSISLICHCSDDIRYAGIISDEYEEDDFFKHTSRLRGPMSETSMLNHYITGDETHNTETQKMIPDVGYLEAIERYCEKYNFKSDMTFKVFGPMKTESFLIYCIISIPSSIGDKYYKLKKDSYFFTYASYYDACISYMIDYIRSVKITDNERWMPDNYARNNIYQNAARSFLGNVSKFAIIDGSYCLFDDITKISTLNYEKKEIEGKIIVTKKDNFDLKNHIIFKNTIRLSEHRKIRKILETVNRDNFLVTDGAFAYSIGSLNKEYKRNEDGVFIFKISSRFVWKLYCNDRLILKYEYGNPYPEDFIYNENGLIESIDRIITHDNAKDTNRIYNIIKEISTLSHGTTLVFSRNIENEASRLSAEGFLIEPKEIDYSYLHMITAIDGAVLIDNKCVCHSFGVILDGKSAEKKSDSSRGSRYNSAIRYVEQFTKDTDKPLVVVISDDGMIDFFPKLQKRQRKTEILYKINKFRHAIAKEEFCIDEINSTLADIIPLKAYLSSDQCIILNSRIEYINKKMDQRVIEHYFELSHEYDEFNFYPPEKDPSFFDDRHIDSLESKLGIITDCHENF